MSLEAKNTMLRCSRRLDFWMEWEAYSFTLLLFFSIVSPIKKVYGLES